MAETNNISQENREIYNKKINTVPAPDKQMGVDVDNALYDNIIDTQVSSHVDLSSLNNLTTTAQSRNDIYNVYDTMCEDGTLSAVIETYAEDATERNDAGNIVWVESEDPNIAKLIEYYLDIMNVDKHIFKWTYSLCKYGDVYLRLYRESDYDDALFRKKEPKQLNEDVKIVAYNQKDKYSKYVEMVQNPAKMFEVTKCGKTVGYVEAPVNNTISKSDDIFTSFIYKYKVGQEDVTLYPATEFVHAALESDVSRVEEQIHLFNSEEDYKAGTNKNSFNVRRGQSLLSDVFKTWRELSLLENSVLLCRLTRSATTRVINVEVGDMPKENVKKLLMSVKQMVEQKSALNAGNSLTEYTNPGPIENNIYVPSHEQKGQITTSLIGGGDVDVRALADIDHYVNKLFGQLRVPKQYFGYTDDAAGFNGGTSLSIISSRYAKMIKRIQNTMLQALTDAINLFLIDAGLDNFVNKFKLHMLPPTTQEEIDRRDNLSAKIQLISDIMNMVTDVEDQVVKLNILKSLLANSLDDTSVIDELTTYIEELENEAGAEAGEPVEDFGEEDLGNLGGGSSVGSVGSDFGGEMESDMEDDTSLNDLAGEEIEPTDDSNDILPSGEDLGIDLADSEE